MSTFRIVMFVFIMIGAVALFISRVIEGYKAAEARKLAAQQDAAKKNGPLS